MEHSIPTAFVILKRLVAAFFLFSSVCFAQGAGTTKAAATPKSLDFDAVTFGFLTWEESNKVLNATGEAYKIKTLVYATSLGYQYVKYFPTWGLKANGQILFGAEDSTEDDPGLIFAKKGTMVAGAQFEPVIFWLPEKASRVSLGLSLPLTYKAVVAENVTAGYFYERQSSFNYGIGGEIAWRVYRNKVHLQQRISVGPNYKDAMWSFSLAYIL